MSDESVVLTLINMMEEDGERLPQYIVRLHGPDGWSLRQIASAIGCSPEWVRQLELKGMRQIAEGDRKDLSDLPLASRRRKRTIVNAAEYLPPETVAVLTSMNKEAESYRRGKAGRLQVEAFNRMVQLLLDAGVPMNSIARAVGANEETFYRRMRRWGVRSPAFDKQGEVVKPKPKVKVDYCTDPTCPIKGQHAHG